jgi:hypothetical protein
MFSQHLNLREAFSGASGDLGLFGSSIILPVLFTPHCVECSAGGIPDHPANNGAILSRNGYEY